MKDNRGFTLIELIVVMMIMAILAVGSVAALHMADTGSANHAAKRILSVLDYVQMENMTKTKTYDMKIIWDDTKKKYVLQAIASGETNAQISEILNLKNEQINYWYSDGAINTQYAVNKSNMDNEMKISFHKDTGGVIKEDTKGYVSRISITSAGMTSYIRIVAATGKHFIE